MQRIIFYEREKIELYLRMGKKKKWISDKLKRDYSVVKREIKRNSGEYIPYTAIVAQRVADRKAKNTNKRKLDKFENRDLKEYVIEKLKEDNWSPEEIAGRLKKYPCDNISETISYESIYDWIYNGKGKFEHLYPYLKVGRPKRQKKFSRKYRSNSIPNRVSIHKRPKEIDKKKVFGHWEADSMVFKKQKPILSSQYERKSMFCKLYKLKDKTAEETERVLQESIDSMPYFMFKSITRDNGGENAYHEKTEKEFDVQSFFCDPYCSWQKGGVENLNKLVRWYLPKNQDMSKITDEYIYLIQERLNNRPRKKLNFLTPNEFIAYELEKGALNS